MKCGIDSVGRNEGLEPLYIEFREYSVHSLRPFRVTRKRKQILIFSDIISLYYSNTLVTTRVLVHSRGMKCDAFGHPGLNQHTTNIHQIIIMKWLCC